MAFRLATLARAFGRADNVGRLIVADAVEIKDALNAVSSAVEDALAIQLRDLGVLGGGTTLQANFPLGSGLVVKGLLALERGPTVMIALAWQGDITASNCNVVIELVGVISVAGVEAAAGSRKIEVGSGSCRLKCLFIVSVGDLQLLLKVLLSGGAVTAAQDGADARVGVQSAVKGRSPAYLWVVFPSKKLGLVTDLVDP